jgi:hypothetical protein
VMSTRQSSLWPRRPGSNRNSVRWDDGSPRTPGPAILSSPSLPEKRSIPVCAERVSRTNDRHAHHHDDGGLNLEAVGPAFSWRHWVMFPALPSCAGRRGVRAFPRAGVSSRSLRGYRLTRPWYAAVWPRRASGRRFKEPKAADLAEKSRNQAGLKKKSSSPQRFGP